MSFNSNDPRAEYTATAGQTVFPFLFKIYAEADLVVYLTPDGNTPDDVADLLTLTTDYTVTINGDAGGSITLVSPASLNDAVTLVRSLDITRTTEYQTSGDLLAETLNDDQEYQTYLTADQNAQSTRFLKFSENSQGVDNTLPAPVGETYIRWNTAGTALENDLTSPSWATAAAQSASDAADSATAAGVSETNAGNSEAASATSATNSEDSNLESGSWANENEDVPVKEYTSGTPSDRSPVVYSAKHWAAKASAIATGSAENISVNAAGFVGNLSPTDTDVQTALETIDGLNFSQQLPAPTLDSPADTTKNTPVSYTVSSISLEGTGTRTVTLDMGTASIDTPTSSEGVANVVGQTVVVTGVTSASISVGANYTTSGTFTVQAKVDAPGDANYSESNYSPSDSIGVLLNTPTLNSPSDADIDTDVPYIIDNVDAQADKIVFDVQSADFTITSSSSGTPTKVGNTVEIIGYTAPVTLTLQYTAAATYNNRVKVQDTGAIYPDSAFSATDSIVISAGVVFDIFGDGSATSLWELDGDLTDTGGTYDGTAVGTPSYDSINKQVGTDSLAVGADITKTFTTTQTLGANSTISMWVRMTSDQGGNWITDSTANVDVINSRTDNVQKVRRNNATVFSTTSAGDRLIPIDTSFHHLIIKDNGSAITVKVDNVVQTNTASYVTMNGFALQVIGGHIADSPNSFNGNIDHIRTFNKATSDAEDTILFNE